MINLTARPWVFPITIATSKPGRITIISWRIIIYMINNLLLKSNACSVRIMCAESKSTKRIKAYWSTVY